MEIGRGDNYESSPVVMVNTPGENNGGLSEGSVSRRGKVRSET